tara:strand:+ start:77 stop:196 length:120 start_codon:yes stop_codon:yes gene_type:complete
MKIFILYGVCGTRLDNLSKIIAKPVARISKELTLPHNLT